MANLKDILFVLPASTIIYAALRVAYRTSYYTICAMATIAIALTCIC
jgi:hypothetical protein